MSRRSQRRKDQVRVRANLHTLSLLAVVLAMGYSGAVQTNGAAYLLAFLTAALGALSYVHARANLRGLEIIPGAVGSIQAGRQGMLPVALRAATGQSPCGLELLAVGAAEPALVERISSGETQRVSVALPAEAEGLQKSVRLLVRSAYPLGLFSAERQMDVDCVRRVHPRPVGDEPLPEPDPALRDEALAFAGGAGQPTKEGDDFAGLREWQLGDSPRHIDWRALARGRPLMVKTWAGNAPAAVRLDWGSLAMPEHQRTEQMAKWIETCERRALPYAMRLPDSDVPVGLGPAHAQRCLNALADRRALAAAPAEPTGSKRARIPASHERSAHLPGKPLALLCVGLGLAALPLWPVVAPASLILLAVCFLIRWHGGGKLYGGWLPVALAALGIVGVLLREGTVFTTEAGIAVLLVLQGCKLLEARSPHDFQVLAMIGWFVCLCGLLAEQSLERSLFSTGVFAYITVCMIRFRRSSPGMAVPVRLGGVLLAQALPIAVVLFLLFPRGTLDALARRMGTGSTTTSGVPMELEPGTIASVVASDATAFRVRFGNGRVPPNPQRYWRCVVLWECQGLSWKKGATLLSAPTAEYEPQPDDVRQEIDMEPHGQIWLPALDRPIRGATGSGVLSPEYDGTLQGRELLRRPRRLAALSRTTAEPSPLPESHRAAALKQPPVAAESLKALAAQWRAVAGTDVEVVQAGLAYLRRGGFSYTLDPGPITGPNALEEFWFNRRAGFCSHFSASFGSMMRLAGVPSRVVLGYLGGTWNATGNYLMVRQSDAHAWVEVWLEQSGWTRIDPTAVLAPSRLNLDLQGSLLGDEDEAHRQRNSLWWRTYENAALFWDNVSYQWDTRVIQFDEEAQIDWLANLGMSRMGGGQWRDAGLLLACGGVLAAGLGMLMLWLRRPARHNDPWARAWQQLCQRLIRLGLPERLPSEGPLAYARRVAPAAPDHAEEVERLAGVYAAARYGEMKASLKDYHRAVRRLKKRR